MITCDICKKVYASNSSLWNHKNKIHHLSDNKTTTSPDNISTTSANEEVIITNKKKYTCTYCNHTYMHRNSRNVHMKTCKMKDVSGNELIELRNTVKELREEITHIKQQQASQQPSTQINNDNRQINTNCNINNNNINIIPLGKENIHELLTPEQISSILQACTYDKINKTLLYVYTADNLVNCRNTYVSNLDGKHCKIYDAEQHTFVTKPKEKVLNDVLHTQVEQVRNIVDTHGSEKKQQVVNTYLDNLESNEELQKKKKEEINCILHDNRKNVKPIVQNVKSM